MDTRIRTEIVRYAEEKESLCEPTSVENLDVSIVVIVGRQSQLA